MYLKVKERLEISVLDNRSESLKRKVTSFTSMTWKTKMEKVQPKKGSGVLKIY